MGVTETWKTAAYSKYGLLVVFDLDASQIDRVVLVAAIYIHL